MTTDQTQIFRVLVTDDDDITLAIYRKLFTKWADGKLPSSIRSADAEYIGSQASTLATHIGFELVCATAAEEAVTAVDQSLRANRPFSLAFLDIRMPPGPDGIWAAVRIRELDPDIDIVIVTAFSDFDPETTAQQVPPVNKLFYLKKPFDPLEILQLASALSAKWLAEQSIRELAYFDSLTGLPNRRFLLPRLTQALAQAKRHSRRLALLFLDLDNFKRINDTLGHDIGDLLLQQTAERLSGCMRSSDEVTRNLGNGRSKDVARLGGDEFTLLLTEIRHCEDVVIVAQRIVESLSLPFDLAGNQVHITPSIGIVVYPEDGTDAQTLLKNADLSMYNVKQNGRGHYRCYNPEMEAKALRRLAVENQLRQDLSEDRLSLQYQPMCSLHDNEIFGVEALLRWKSDKLGEVMPCEFVTIAEETGIIRQLGEWVLRQACRQAAVWHQAGTPLKIISVNLSMLQFVEPEFPQFVAQVLKETMLDPHSLELEITESLLMQQAENAIPALNALRRLGVRLSIDDFGTGYSSLARLQQLPIDRVKIDQVFVDGVDTDPDKAAITSAILAVARSLQLEVTAEGVEQPAQLEFLRQQGCGYYQGYLLSHPLGADEIPEFIAHHAKSSGIPIESIA